MIFSALFLLSSAAKKNKQAALFDSLLTFPSCRSMNSHWKTPFLASFTQWSEFNGCCETAALKSVTNTCLTQGYLHSFCIFAREASTSSALGSNKHSVTVLDSVIIVVTVSKNQFDKILRRHVSLSSLCSVI